MITVESPFPEKTTSRFVPDKVTLTYYGGDYRWRSKLPFIDALVKFKRDLCAWFDQIPSGAYTMRLKVTFTDGYETTVTCGKRTVCAPLTKADLFDGCPGPKGKTHEGLLTGLKTIINRADRDPMTVHMHVWQMAEVATVELE